MRSWEPFIKSASYFLLHRLDHNYVIALTFYVSQVYAYSNVVFYKVNVALNR
jgi:hypothetical protein